MADDRQRVGAIVCGIGRFVIAESLAKSTRSNPNSGAIDLGYWPGAVAPGRAGLSAAYHPFYPMSDKRGRGGRFARAWICSDAENANIES